MEIKPIGRVCGGRAVPYDDNWGNSHCRLELDAACFDAEALAGLGDFSHVEVIFVFDRVTDAEIDMGARHPRGRSDWPKVGIFAQRGKNRPNRIGVTICKILQVSGTMIEVVGLDAIDGTPILDIKPVMKEFLPRGVIRQPLWAQELMRNYW
ncbi:MAG: SAM-dependent methyltransferase [Hyphomicrobium sp.]|jgi:tRNA-Thr(GGU) m(6)t(6)A37 methyltransferase TsaA